jgi:glycosyltransferase involved in cell wall biosynthesis
MSGNEIRILFIGPHRPNRNGSQRFRMEQYFPYLVQQGFICDYSWYINAEDDKIFYSHGHWIGKAMVVLKAIKTRLTDVLKANRYDIIFIQREAFIFGSYLFEKQFSRSKAKVIFDFDDAIWLEDTSAANKKFKWLKRPSKTADIIRIADTVIAGNNYLADYARQWNSHVSIIPTVVDTNIYLPAKQIKDTSHALCIGWSGSKTTIKHFEPIVPVLKILKEKFGERIYFKQIGDKSFYADGLAIESSDWAYKNEIEELNKIDIGLMPLPDDVWSKGKCGFKAIQYMALEIAPVASPVGVNTNIITHGITGFLADNQQQWMDCISQLIEFPDLRRQIGVAARKTVEEKYSVQSQLEIMKTLLDRC